jgi:hypothetical protein
MKNEKSTMRRRYETAYRLLRRSDGAMHPQRFFEHYDDARDCALLSYDYRDSKFSGWINRRRMTKFKTHLKRVAFLSELPF